MAMNPSLLSSMLQQSLTEYITITEYDAQNGTPRPKTMVVQPPRQTTDALANNIIQHFQQFAIIDSQVQTQVQTVVQAQVFPGIAVATPVGPGSTVSPGQAQGTGQGTGTGTGIGRIS